MTCSFQDQLNDKEQIRELSINHPLNKNSTMPCMDDDGDELLEVWLCYMLMNNCQNSFFSLVFKNSLHYFTFFF